MKKLTLEDLKAMEPNTIFATGFVSDNEEDINMCNSGRMLRWVAVRGGIWDWAIYCHDAYKSDDATAAHHGDKIYDKIIIRSLINCTDAAFEMYRY